MKLKKILITTVLSLFFGNVVTPIISNNSVSATSDDVTSFVYGDFTYIIQKNDKYVAFENEINNLTKNGIDITEDKYFELVNKYNGAHRQIKIINVYDRVADYGGFQEEFVNGGVNNYAYNRPGIEKLRDYYGRVKLLLLVDSTAAGALIGGPIGALIGAIGGTHMSAKFNDAQNDMKKWFDAGSNRGGARVTLTEEFPIDNLYSTSQARIRYLR